MAHFSKPCFHKKDVHRTPTILYQCSSWLIFFTIFSSKILQLKTASLTPSVESTSSSLILNSSFIQSKIARRYHPAQNVKNPHVFLKLAGESGMLQHHNHRFSSSSPPPTLPPYFTSPTTISNSISKTTIVNALDDNNHHQQQQQQQYHYLFSPSPSQNSKLFSYTSSSSKRPPIYNFQNEQQQQQSKSVKQNSPENEDTSSSSAGSSASAEDIEVQQKQKQDQDYYSSESESELTGSDEIEELTPQQTQQHHHAGAGAGGPFYQSQVQNQNNLWTQSTASSSAPNENLNSLAPPLPSPSSLTSSNQNQNEGGQGSPSQSPSQSFSEGGSEQQQEARNLFQFSSPSQQIPSTTTTNPIKFEAAPGLLDSQQKADRRADDIDHDLNDLLNLNPSSLYPFTLNDFEHGAVADDDQISRYFIKTRPRGEFQQQQQQQQSNQQQQEQGRTTVSVSVSPIIDFTSSPPVTISRLSSVSSNSQNPPFQNHGPSEPSPIFLQSVTESNNGNGHGDENSFSSTSTAKSALLDLAESQQSKSQLFDTHLFAHDMTYGAASSSLSTLPATSTNALPTSYNDKDEYTLPPGPAPSSLPLTTTSSTDATSIPGMAGIDYPILGEIPYTGFDCQKQRYKGFFADVHTKCQAWHYCDFSDGHSTFLCPNGTLFSQVLLTCDWWFNVDCSQALQLYVLNERLYRYIKPPKPSFPEDFYGPQVDLWLSQQLQLGLLPKMKKKVKDKVVIMGSH